MADWLAIAKCYYSSNCSSNKDDFGSPNIVFIYIDIKKDTGSNNFGSNRSVRKVLIEPDVSPIACWTVDNTKATYL